MSGLQDTTIIPQKTARCCAKHTIGRRGIGKAGHSKGANFQSHSD